jgi:hypothetical protein
MLDGLDTAKTVFWASGRLPFPYRIMGGLPVTRPEIPLEFFAQLVGGMRL